MTIHACVPCQCLTVAISFCLSDNYPTALGGAVLSNALKSNTSIRELYWRGNELGNEGIKALCSSLQERSTQMAVLDVGNNRSVLVCMACAKGCTCMQHGLAGCILRRHQALALWAVTQQPSTHKAGLDFGGQQGSWG